MHYKQIKLSVLLLLGFGLTGLTQESINTAGGNASGSGGSASYSTGQVAWQIHTGTNGSVAEGVQQPYEISVVTAIEETEEIHLSISAYPNPTNDYLTLEVKDAELVNLSFQLYDIQGNILQKERIEGNLTRIAMGQLVPATYFVKVTRDARELKVFKIVKK